MKVRSAKRVWLTNRWTVPGFVINPVPGTDLFETVLKQIPGVKNAGFDSFDPAHLKPGHYALCPLPYSDSLAAQFRHKMLLVIRDPREVALARAGANPDSGRILAAIRGDGEQASIDACCRSVLRWHKFPFTYLVTLERLTGPRPDRIAQIAALTRHVGLRCSPRTLARIADSLPDSEPPAWRECFSDAHIAAFKAVAGPLLVELGYEPDHGW